MRRGLIRIINAIVGLAFVVCYMFPGLVFTLAALREESAFFALLALTALVAGAVFVVLRAFPKFTKPFSDAAGSARMGTRKDLRKANLLGIDSYRIYLGRKSQPVSYGGEGHIVTVGPPRSGKGTALAVPNLWYSDRSMVVLDPKAELAAITYRHRRKKGPVLVINPKGVLTDTHPHLRSCGFNPFAVPTFLQSLFSSCGSIVDSLIELNSTKEEIFPLGARELLHCLSMMAVIEDPENASLADVNEMLRFPYSSENEKVKTIQKLMRACSQPTRQQLAQNPHRQSLANLCNQFTEGGRTNDSFIASARIPLKNLNDPELLADLSRHPTINGRAFDFEMLKHQCITVYIVLPDDKLKGYNFWLRLIVAQALDALKATLPGENNPLFLIDEAGNLGPLDALKTGMSMGAGKGITIWTFWQSLGQLEELYTQYGARTFLSDSSVINAFGGLDFHSAELLSKMMGNRTEITARFSQPSDEIKKPSKSEEATGYALRRPEAIRGMPKGKLLTIVNAQPYELDAPGYFDLNMSGLDPNPYRRKASNLVGKLSYGRA